jgi:hypothetical protein
MLKMHVPPPAVEHKMKSDGVSDALVAVLFPDSAKAPAAEAVEQAEAPPALTDEEEKIAGKYRKMLKMNVPAQAVNNKMAQEGVAKNIIDALFPPAAGGEEEEKKAGGGKKAAPEKLAPKAQPKGRTTGTGVALMSLHWTPLSEDAVKSSVWGKVGKAVFGGAVGGSKGGKEGEGEGEEGEKKTHDKDILHLESLFHKKSGQKKSAAAKTTTANKKQVRRERARVLRAATLRLPASAAGEPVARASLARVARAATLRLPASAAGEHLSRTRVARAPSTLSACPH